MLSFSLFRYLNFVVLRRYRGNIERVSDNFHYFVHRSQAQKLVIAIMPINKISQLVATVIDYPYLDVDYAVVRPVPLVIDSAIYYDPSAPDNSLDVEPYLTPLILNNQLSFIVENATFGGNRTDPARGKVKELKITYSYNGIKSTMICKEKATVALQCF